jgi:cytochrome c biogenesis factor
VAESLINWINFFWTSSSYLPIFFTALVLSIFNVAFFSHYTTTSFLLIGFGFLYSGEFFDLIFLNSTPNLSSIGNTSLNLLLWNNLNKYHPVIFYGSSVVLLLLLLQYPIRGGGTKPFLTGWVGPSPVLYLFIGAWLITLALALGSLWAYQESTWGGWWNWDPSETFGLFLFFTLLASLHMAWGSSNGSSFFEKSSLLIYIFLFLYFFIQLNFDLTSHSFGTRFTSLFNNTLFFFEGLELTLGTYLYVLVLTTVRRSDYVTYSYLLLHRRFYSKSLKPHVLLTLLLLVSVLVVLSFTPIINYFIWRYFWLISFNLSSSREVLGFIWYVLFLPYFRLASPYYFIILPLLTTLSGLNLLSTAPTLLTNVRSWFTFFHSILLLLILVNLLNNQFSLLYTSPGYPFSSSTKLVTKSTHLITYVSCHSYFIENSMFEIWPGRLANFNYSLYSTPNSSAMLDLKLQSNSDNFLTNLILSAGFNKVCLITESFNFSPFTDLVTLLCLFNFGRSSKMYTLRIR